MNQNSKIHNPTIEQMEEYKKGLPFIGISDSLKTRITLLKFPAEKPEPIQIAMYRHYVNIPIGMELTYNKEKYRVVDHKLNLNKGIFDVIIK